MLDTDKAFATFFPSLYGEFKEQDLELKAFQRRAIATVTKEANTLCIMPTGGGKSLIYWISGVLLGGVTLVVSPLIALIDEQAEKLSAQGLDVLRFHSGIEPKEQEKLLLDFARGAITPAFIFASPERIATDGLFEYCMKERRSAIKLLVVDEVHCVSQWGNSFRPFYKRIPDFMERVYGSLDRPRTLALTATLNPKELVDICREFSIEQRHILKDDLLMRTEISLKTLCFTNEQEKEDRLWDLLTIHAKEKTLVYVYRVKGGRSVEQFAERATEQGYEAVHFHGDMTATERQDVITRFRRNEVNLIFATNAFGMGIDIPDIRVVIHYMIPESVEQLYQEVGRAARDGGTANAYLLYSNKNVEVKRTHFINKSFPDRDTLLSAYKRATGNKAGLKLLSVFEDPEIKSCLPYFLSSGAVTIQAKGFSGLKHVDALEDQRLADVINSSKTKSLLTTVKKTELEVQTIIDMVYEAVVKNRAKLHKPLDKVLFLDVLEDTLTEDMMRAIDVDIAEKRCYKHGLLDYLVYLIHACESSNELHQEIAKYLGVEKHMLNKMYSTINGDMVRSKSEVIIANLLASHGIPYEYERKLEYDRGKWMEPDFTLKKQDGTLLFWEHLGMLGVESYDNRWMQKQGVYEQFFRDRLVVTYEGTHITNDALKIIKSIACDS